jgi:hypothetical protein
MRVDKFLRQMGDYRVTSAQLAYARYLEQEGLVFLVDFGFGNAEGIAWDRLEQGQFMLGHA